MTESESSFESWDGARIFYRAWAPARAARGIFLFHRGHEHSGRWAETVAALGIPNTAFFAWDQRGHGRSAGARGHAPDLGTVIKDADMFARHVAAAHGIATEETAIVASSLGGVIAAAWVHDFAPPVRGMVLAAPAFRVRLYVPGAIPGLRLLQRVLPRAEVKSFVKAGLLTHDPAQAAAYDADPLIFRQIAVNMLLDLHDAGQRLLTDAATIDVPTLLLVAGRDYVVDVGAQREFFRRLGSRVKQMEMYPAMHHALFHESRRQCVTDRIRMFLQEVFCAQPDRLALLEADKGGVTRAEYDLLRAPGGRRWGAMRAGLKIAGAFSRGIRLGWEAGFDSGKSLDYVYRDQARGRLPGGRIIDRMYLNAPGWRGIRVRRRHLGVALEKAMRALHAAERAVHILDIASGPGRYVLETMRRLRDVPATATLRDYQAGNVEAARALAEEMGLSAVTAMEGDAFDGESLAATLPRATIGIASGLYELFAENAAVLRSLRGIAAALEPEGFLLYTCQIWHPQMEFIARTLVNREGKPWIMRRRTQAEMDTLAREVGFTKQEQWIDRWGIFTASLARRVRAELRP